jgi:hypothetical protein
MNDDHHHVDAFNLVFEVVTSSLVEADAVV